MSLSDSDLHSIFEQAKTGFRVLGFNTNSWRLTNLNGAWAITGETVTSWGGIVLHLGKTRREAFNALRVCTSTTALIITGSTS